MLMTLISLLIFLVIIPYILFAVVMIKIWEAVCTVIHPAGLMTAAWLTSLGLYLLPSTFPSNTGWITMVERVAQFTIFGLKTPFALFALAGVALVVALFARMKRVETTPKP